MARARGGTHGSRAKSGGLGDGTNQGGPEMWEATDCSATTPVKGEKGTDERKKINKDPMRPQGTVSYSPVN